MIKCQAKLVYEDGELVREHNYKFYLDQKVWYIREG